MTSNSEDSSASNETTGPWYQATVGTAIVAGVFSLIVLGFLVQNYFMITVYDAARTEKLEAMKIAIIHDYQPNLGVGDDGYAGLIRIADDENDSGGKVSAGTVTAAYANFGDREAPLVLVSGINDEATMQEIAGYYYTEGARLALLIDIRDLAWSQSWRLECGDIVTMTRPWKSGTLDIRIIEVVKNFETERVSLVGVTV